MDQLINLKTQLLSELNVNYRNLVTFINGLAVNEKFKQYGFLNLDQGIRWIQDGIQLMQTETSPAQVEPVEEVKDQPDNKCDTKY